MNFSLINILKLRGQGVISILGAGGKTSLMFKLAKELAESGKKVLTTTTTKIFMPDSDQSPEIITADSVAELIDKSKSCLARFNHFSAGSKQISTLEKLKGFDPDIIDKLCKADCFDWIIVEADGAKRKSLKASDVHEPLIPGSTTHLIHVTGLDSVGKILDEDHVHRAKIFSDNTGLPLGEIIDEKVIVTSAVLEIKKAGAAIFDDFFSCMFLNKADNQEEIKYGENIARIVKSYDIADSGIVDMVVIGSLMNRKPVKCCFDIHTRK